MQLLLKKNGAKTLIIFFSGWALGYNPFAHLFSNDLFLKNDLLFVWDYSTMDFDFDFSKYEKINLVSFSYGVFMSQFVDLPKLDKNIAICGTLCPIDTRFGINPKMFDLTLKTLNENTLEKFYKNMFSTNEDYKKFAQINDVPQNIEKLKTELQNIKNLSTMPVPFSRNFDKAFVALSDRIIPPNAQMAFWENKTQVKTISCGHFPFFKYDTKGMFNGG